MSILDRIRANGGEVIRDRYRISIRRGRLSDKALAWVSAHKDELIREIWPEYDDWLERAAIREFDGGQSRDTANDAAYDEVIAYV